MKRTLTLLLFSLAFLISEAQRGAVSFVPINKDTTFIVDLVAAYQPLALKGYLQNNTNQTIKVRWERNPIELPSDWSIEIQDKNAAYPEFVDSNIDDALYINEPVILKPKERVRLDVYLTPNGKIGSAIIGIDVSLADSPEVVISSDEFHVEVRSRFRQRQQKGTRIFPNPSDNFLNLSNMDDVDRLVVYNMVGRAVKTFEVEEGTRYEVGNLPDGIYLVGLFDKKGNILKTVRISKRGARP
ncbi:MAG: T9SS type A sorting domain-containing protein [Bacteroidota bacterium]